MNADFTVRAPDDFHVHFRSGEMLRAVVPETARHFARALVMPNVPAIEDGFGASSYREEIVAARDGYDFEPLMTIKLTARTTPGLIREASAMGVVAAKLYPSGATTGSHDGIAGNPRPALDPVFAAMAECGMVLCIHGEDPDAFILDREAAYLRYVLDIACTYTDLRVVMEHITTGLAAITVGDGPDNLAATVTAHHLLHTLDDVLSSGLRPHHFCYPVPKRPEDRKTLRQIIRFCPRIFFGSDSAPHPLSAKESACGCAGVFSAPVALAVLADVFGIEDGGLCLEKLNAFTSERGADFYGLPRNTGTIRLIRQPWRVPESIGGVVPLMAGLEVGWNVLA